MSRLDPIPYPDAQIRAILERVRAHRDGRGRVELESAQLLRHEVLAALA